MCFSLADFFAINKRTIFATKIADADIGRINIEEAVIAGNGGVFVVVGNFGIAVFSAADDAGGAGFKGEFLTFEIALCDGEGDF